MSTHHPNIILIMTDQQRFDTLAAWGHSHMITPHMDRIVRNGVSFRQAYCPGATCVASRAAIFTGMYAHNTGVYTFQDWASHRTWVEDLADHGYHCVNMGKMHFTPRDVSGGFHERVIVENPTNSTHYQGGVDDDWGRYLQWHGAERPNRRNQTDAGWLEKYQGVPWHLDEHLHSDVFIGMAAENWINQYRGQEPFFLQVGLTGPHEPWDPLPRHLELYSERDLPKPVWRAGELDEKPPQHRAHQQFLASTGHESVIDMRQIDEAGMDRMRRHYYAKITTVDEQIGRVLAALERRGWLQDAWIIFCSDHGELLGDHHMAYKWLMYDPIVHVPLVICPPRAEQWSRSEESEGRNQQTTDIHDLVSLIDLGPTILEMAGIDVPTYHEGHSLLPYVQPIAGAREINAREYVFAEDNYQIMMRGNRHKLVYYIGQEMGELYDLEADPHELDNLWQAPSQADLRQTLLNELLAWLATSTYYNAGYKRGQQRHYTLRWPSDGDAKLHGANLRAKQIDVL